MIQNIEKSKSFPFVAYRFELSYAITTCHEEAPSIVIKDVLTELY